MSLSFSERPLRILPSLMLGLALLAAAPLGAGVNRWTSIGPYGGEATALEFSANGRTAWAGTKTLGVFRSTDNGHTWTAASLGLSGEVLDLAASSTAAGWVYAVTSSGVFRSEDAGLHWTAVNKGLPIVEGRVDALRVATEPTEPAAVWVVGLEGIPYRSTNLGARWRPAGRGIKGYVADIAAHPHTAGVVFAATNQGLFRSSDSGGHWSPAGLHGLLVSQVVFDRVQPRHLYAITLEEGVQDVIIGRIFFSDDGGASWKQSNRRHDIYGRFELVADPTRAGIAWLSSSESYFSVLRTRDGGQNWQGVLRSDRFETLALAANPLRSGTVLVGNLQGWRERPAVLRTDTGGTSWSPSGTGLAAQTVAKVLPDPSKPGALYVHGGCCSLWKRTGPGQPFKPFSPTLFDPDGYRLDFRGLIFDPKTPATLYLVASRSSSYLYKSVDAGATWQQAGRLSSIIDSFLIDSITIDPAHPSRLYGASQVYNDGIYRSDDGGFSWSLLSGYPPNGAELVTVTATAVYMHSFDYGPSYRHSLRRSTDGGTTWTNLLELGGAPVEAVAEDPRDPQRLWTALSQYESLPATGGVYRSTDGGAHWSFSRMAGNRPVFALALDPRNSNRVWAASSGAVFLSEDGGATWVSFSEGLPAVDVYDLRLEPSDPDTVYAGTEGGGVYEFTRRRL